MQLNKKYVSNINERQEYHQQKSNLKYTESAIPITLVISNESEKKPCLEQSGIL